MGNCTASSRKIAVTSLESACSSQGKRGRKDLSLLILIILTCCLDAIYSELEHDADGLELNYYFVGMAGGESNTRMMEGVGIPKGVACFDGTTYKTDSHEFSGVFDVSGLLRKDDSGAFAVSAEDAGAAKRESDRQVGINDKYIINVLQAHSYECGVVSAFNVDQGGQWMVYQPDIPEGKAGAVTSENLF